MAYFAKLGTGNIVEQVVVVNDSVATSESAGITFLKELYKDNNAVWKQTYKDGTRFNFAGPGFTYNATLDGFIPVKVFPSWILDEDTCKWKAPIDMPVTTTNGENDEFGNPRKDKYYWNENKGNWELNE